MGSVPSTVFERLLEAVAAAESAPLMEQLNTAAERRAQPACRWHGRWCATCAIRSWPNWAASRRSCSQISADERARAARTALLFTEEELTRNLQIVLRTFDDLNYRQEQRFHLELGLLKLIHAQRLLPIEELLSGVAGAGARTPTSAPRASASSARPASASSHAAGAPVREPSGWSATTPPRQSAGPETGAVMSRSTATAESTMAGSTVARELSPFPVVGAQAAGNGSSESLTEGALAKAPEAAKATGQGSSTERLDVDSIRQDIVTALATAGHGSAAQLLGNGAWRLESTSVQVSVPGMGKKMLSLTVNAAAEKIVRQELQRLGAPTRFVVSSGEGSAPVVVAAAVAAPVALVGSVQEAALAHPMVKRAQEIFEAEVRSVVDLRQK